MTNWLEEEEAKQRESLNYGNQKESKKKELITNLGTWTATCDRVEKLHTDDFKIDSPLAIYGKSNIEDADYPSRNFLYIFYSDLDTVIIELGRSELGHKHSHTICQNNLQESVLISFLNDETNALKLIEWLLDRYDRDPALLLPNKMQKKLSRKKPVDWGMTLFTMFGISAIGALAGGVIGCFLYFRSCVWDNGEGSKSEILWPIFICAIIGGILGRVFRD